MATKNVAVKEKEATHVDFTNILTPAQLKQQVELEADRRRIIKEFVTSQLEEGKDYGTIPVRSRSGAVSQSKPVLFKSGMEKIFSMFNVVSTLEKDTETIEMISKPGVIAYKCKLYRGERFIGEGRGAADVSEKGRVNDAIKIAEKRARMDACLNLGFSEYFTQDLEDPSYEEPVENTPEAVQTVRHKSPAWQSGEVKDVDFTVQSKEVKTAQSGTTYSVLETDKGQIKAWKNTQDKFEEGKRYKAAIEANEWNGALSFSVVRVYRELPEEE